MSIVHKKKIESNKKLIFKKKFRFPKFPLFNPLAYFDLNLLEKGWTKYLKNGLKSFHISHPSICTIYLFWVRKLIQLSSPDSSVQWGLTQVYLCIDVPTWWYCLSKTPCEPNICLCIMWNWKEYTSSICFTLVKPVFQDMWVNEALS